MEKRRDVQISRLELDKIFDLKEFTEQTAVNYTDNVRREKF